MSTQPLFLDLILNLIGLTLLIAIPVFVIRFILRSRSFENWYLYVAFAVTFLFHFENFDMILRHVLDTCYELVRLVQDIFDFHFGDSDLFPAASFSFSTSAATLINVVKFVLTALLFAYILRLVNGLFRAPVDRIKSIHKEDLLVILIITLSLYLGISAIITAPITRQEGVDHSATFTGEITRELDGFEVYSATEVVDDLLSNSIIDINQTITEEYESYPWLERVRSLVASKYLRENQEFFETRLALDSISQEEYYQELDSALKTANIATLGGLVYDTYYEEFEQNSKLSTGDKVIDLVKGLLGKSGNPMINNEDYYVNDSLLIFYNYEITYIQRDFELYLKMRRKFELLSNEIRKEAENFTNDDLPAMKQSVIQSMKQADKLPIVTSTKIDHKVALENYYIDTYIERSKELEVQASQLVNMVNRFLIETAAPVPSKYDLLHGYVRQEKLALGVDSVYWKYFVVSPEFTDSLDQTTTSLVNSVNDHYAFSYEAKLRTLERTLYHFERSWQQMKESQMSTPEMPESPKPGDNLGVFRSIMGWLLQIQSHSLVLIIGLIGFGLLGAAGATFIKETGRREKHGGPFVEDLPGLLVKGFSAALVVFLAFQGSLALLTGASGTPPDESLFFFLALVAAVFSDRTWEWARNRFQNTLEQVESEGKKQSEQPEEAKQPEKPE